jgi:hypothetical protein
VYNRLTFEVLMDLFLLKKKKRTFFNVVFILLEKCGEKMKQEYINK